MSPEVRGDRGGDRDDVDTPRWWDDAEHFVRLHKRVHMSAAEFPDLDVDDDETVYLLPGEAYPDGFMTPKLWDGMGQRTAALSAEGERLDRPDWSEKNGEISSDGVEVFRREQGLNRTETETVYVCGNCDKQFAQQNALNGHQSHCRADDEDVEDGAQTVAGDGGTDTPSLTVDAVEDADVDELRALAHRHVEELDPDGFGPDRLRAELRARAEDTDHDDTENA